MKPILRSILRECRRLQSKKRLAKYGREEDPEYTAIASSREARAVAGPTVFTQRSLWT